MTKNQKTVLALIIVAIVILIIFTLTQNNKNTSNTIINSNSNVETITEQERVDTAINSVTNQLKQAGLVLSNKVAIQSTELDAKGYSYLVNDEIIKIYYMESYKLSNLTENGTLNGETTVTINGRRQKAFAYRNILILDCTSSITIETLNNTLGQKR